MNLFHSYLESLYLKKKTYQNINVKAPRRNFPAALRLYFIDLINQITLLKCTINDIKHVNIEQLIPIIIVNVVICIYKYRKLNFKYIDKHCVYSFIPIILTFPFPLPHLF